MPPSTNILHELFHLLLGLANSRPFTTDNAGNRVYYEQYEPNAMSTLGINMNLVNPETYCALAVAHWLTRNTALVNGNRVEFYGFFTTRG
jgi:hypothetical protein